MESALLQQLELLVGAVVLFVLLGTLWLLWHLLLQQGRLLLRLESFEARVAEAGRPPPPRVVAAATSTGLTPGTRAPDFRLIDQQDQPVTLSALLRRGKPVVLLFADPGCEPCAALFPDIGRWQHDYQR